MSSKKGGKKKGEESEHYSKEKFMAAMEARLPGGKKTKRNPILKLELGTGDPRNQVKIVSDTVYGLADIPHVPSREYTKWRTVDEALFGDAISAYQGTIDPFKQQPRVYKIESIKEKVWEGTRDKTEENFAKEEEEYMKRKALLDARKAKMAAKKKEAIAKAEAAGGKVANPLAAKVDEGMKMMEESEQNKELPPLTLEEQLETYLDPFEPPAPWIKEVHKGELTYVNEETKERMLAKPGTKYEELEIWRNKLQMLEQLTPREDLDGYEYRETDVERRRRQRYINDFEKGMQEEIKRREEDPNDMEILEDVLFDIVDNICSRQEKEDRAIQRAEKRAIQATWHTLCNGFRMKELESIENEDGEIDREVTDLDFTDMIIGPYGHMLSLQTPPGLFEKHEKEREEKAEIDEQKRMIEEAERNKPFVDKAKIILALARNDPKAAAKKVYRGMKEKALEPIRFLRVKENRQKLSKQSKEFLLNGLKSMIQASKTPKSSAIKMAKSMYDMYKRTFFVEETDPNQQALEDILNAIDGKEKVVEVKKDLETEEERRLRLWRASQPKPVKHANCVMITMTFLLEPPAPWKWRKPRTWKDDVADAKEKAKEAAQDIKYKLLPMIPPIVDGINDKVMAPIGQDAIELDEEKFLVPKAVLRRQITERRPWEQRDHDHMSNATAKPVSHSKFVSRILGIESAEDKEKRLAEEAEIERLRLEEEEAKEQARLALEAKKDAEIAKAEEKRKNKEEKEKAKQKAREEKKRKKEERARKANGDGDDDSGIGSAASENKTDGDDGSPSKKKQKQPVAGVDFLGDTTADGAPIGGQGDGTTDPNAQQEGSKEEKKDGEAGEGEGGEEVPLTEEEQRRLLLENVKATVLKDHINPNTLVLNDEQREDEYKAWLRKKQLLDDPEAYNRSSFKIPKLPKLTSGPIDVSVPTKAEFKDKLRNSIRKVIEPVHVKDVIDASERKRFESMLLEELSEACTLPIGNIQIEEIRRLPVNDAKLIALKRRNEEYEAARVLKEKDKAEAIRADQEARKEKNNWYKYGYEEEMIYETRRFIEDYAEKKGHDPDEIVQKLGITREQLKWNRYDEMDLDETGKFVPKGWVEPDDSPSAAEREAIRKAECVEMLLETYKEEEDFPSILSVYEDICDAIQQEEDDKLARLEEERLAEVELERQAAVRDILLEKFTVHTGESVLVDMYEEMCIEVNRRDLEDRQIIRDGQKMYSEDMCTRLYLIEEEFINSEASREAAAQLRREEERDELEKQRLLDLKEAELKNLIRAARQQEKERQSVLRQAWMERYAEHTDEESGVNELVSTAEDMREQVFKRVSLEMPVEPPTMHIEMIAIAPALTVAADTSSNDIGNDNNHSGRAVEKEAVGDEESAVLFIADDVALLSEANTGNDGNTGNTGNTTSNGNIGNTTSNDDTNAISNTNSDGNGDIKDAKKGEGDFTPGQVVVAHNTSDNDTTGTSTDEQTGVVPSLPPLPPAPVQSLVVVTSPFDSSLLVDMNTTSLDMPNDDDRVLPLPRYLTEAIRTPLSTPRPSSEIPAYDHTLVVECMMDMLIEVDARVFKEERAVKEEVWARQAAEHDEWLNEFNWTRHSTGNRHEQYLTYLTQRQEEHKLIPPRKPTDFKLGITNPSDLDNDPKNFIAQAVKPASQEERRKRRIKFLWQRQEQRLEGIKKVIHDYKAMKAHVIYEADHYYDENWEPLVEGVVFPVMKAMKERIKYRAKKYYNSMRQTYREQKAKFLKIFEKPDTSHILEDTEVKKQLLTIKYAIDKERREIASANAVPAREPWTEDVDDLEEERRLEWREGILMSAQESGDNSMATVVTVYEKLVFKVTRSVEGYTTPYDDRDELTESAVDLNESDETASGRIQQDANTEAVIDEMEEELMKELKKQEELAAFEAERAAKAAQKDPREIEREAHAHFRRLRRYRIREGYDEEVVDLLNKMCIAVDLSEEFEEPAIDIMDQIEDDYDQDPGKAETDSTPPSVVDEEEEKGDGEEGVMVEDAADNQEGEEEDNEPLVDDSVRGCEISFMINVTDVDRQGSGLSDLEAEDIAVMLQEQILNPESKLKRGYIGGHAIDLTYKLPFQKRKFDTWEAFWVHIIHPCFFYRSTKKSVQKKGGGRKDGRLESGLIIVNPTHQFSSRSKEAFLALNKRYAPKRAAAPSRRKGGKEQELDPVQKAKMEEMAKKAAKKKEKEKRVVDLQVDEFAADANKLQIVRPNYDSLTKKDVERLRRIHLAFEEKYQMEMLQGLEQPGNRLKIEQYEALKNRDAAFRIWRSAKTRLQSDARKDGTLNEGEVVMPTLKPTHIPDEKFLEWILEIKEEDHEKMVDRIQEKAAQKILREQEADIRKEFQKRRYWYINFCIYDAANAHELGPALHKELMFEAEKKRAALNLEMTEMELQKFESKRNEFQSYVIQEEKGTRALFEQIARWAYTSNIFVRRKKARVLERRNTLIRLGEAHKNRLSSMDPALTITEEGEEDDEDADSSQVTFRTKGESIVSGLSANDSLTGRNEDNHHHHHHHHHEEEEPAVYEDKTTKKVSNEIAELGRRSSKMIAASGDSRKMSIQIRRGSTIIPANISARPIRSIVATVGVTKEGDEGEANDGIEEVKEGLEDDGSIGTAGSGGSGSGSSKGSNVSAELIAATTGTNSLISGGGRGRGRAALKPVVMPNRRNSVAIKAGAGSVLVPDNVPIEFEKEEDLDEIELADDDLNDISDGKDTDSDATESDSDSEDELLQEEEEEKQKGFFGLNLPRLVKVQITQFLSVFKQYKEMFDAYNKKVAEVDQRKFERDEQSRREGAMLKAKLEAQQLMGMTSKEVQRLLDEYWGEVAANKKVTNAMWTSEIPPLKPKLPSQLRIPGPLFRLALGVNWLNIAMESETVTKALMDLPTAEESQFARDELIQYSTIVAEIDPLIKRVQSRIGKHKEEEARLRGLRVDKDKAKKPNPDGLTRKEQREKERLAKVEAANNDISTMTKEEREKMILEKEKEMQAAGMGTEAIRRMKRAEDAKRRQGERERAWLLAHPHRFIKYSEVEPAFCITCKEKLFEQWEESHVKEEKEQLENFDNELMENYEDNEDKITEQVEADNNERLASIQEDIEALYAYQDGKVKDEAEFKKRWEKYEAEMLTYKATGKKQPFPPTKRLRQAPDVTKTRIYLDKVAELENAPPPFIPASIHRAKLCYVDPKGENIIPADAVGGEQISVADNNDDDDSDGDDMHSIESEPHGLRLRVWDRTDMERGPFLGYIELSTDDILRPPAGIRTYKLKTDQKLLEKQPEDIIPVDISGTVTLQLKIIKKDKHTDQPLKWRLEIVRLNKIAYVDRLKKTSPFIEVFWCGPGIKDDVKIHYKRWLPIGNTILKVKTTDPKFDKTKPNENSIFEFPPIWSDLIIPDRGVEWEEMDGGWCSQNRVPSKDDNASGNGAGKWLRLFRKAGLIALAAVKLMKNPRTRLREEKEQRLDMMRELWKAENRERVCMAKEERYRRIVDLEEEKTRAQPLLELQIDYEKKWSSLCMNISNAPKILNRLRFMMGQTADGGGTIIMCQDPATKRMLNILSVPVLYPEDEENMVRHMQPLIGKQHPNLTGVIDFSVHAARQYNLHGEPAVDDRVAIAVLERYEGVNLLDYMQKEWLHLTNDRFRFLLSQIIAGLVALHTENIIHRNFHEKCIIVRQPKNIYDEDQNPDPAKRYMPKEPNLRLADYWFLQNPRAVGCEYSLGRADWGNRGTAPPESLMGAMITDKADVWAFGVCLYHWATGGRTLPGVFKGDDLAKDIPLKWGNWVIILLKMCLARNPDKRASAKEIFTFLSKILGN